MGIFNRRRHPRKAARPNALPTIYGRKALFDALEPRVLFSVLPAPTGLAATAPSTNEVDLTWNNSSGETSYVLQLETATTPAAVWTTIASPAANTTSYAVTSIPGSGSTTVPLTAGTTYNFRLEAVDADGTSTPSSTASAITIPSAPALTDTVSSSGITVNWSAITGAATYTLQRSTNLSSWSSVTLSPVSPATTPPTTYADTGVATPTGLGTLAANTTYYYRLTATDTSGNSDYSQILPVTTLLVAPTGLAATALSTSQIELSWPSEAGAYGYTLQQETIPTTGSPTWSNVAGAGSLSSSTNVFVVGNLTTNTSYSFRLEASNVSGVSQPSTTATTKTLTVAPTLTSAPAAISGSATSNTITWSPVTGATSYVLQHSTDDATWTQIDNPSGTLSQGQTVFTYSDASLTPDTEYFYRIAAVNSGGNSAWSQAISQYTTIAANSTFAAAASSSYSVGLTWASQPTASGFKVQVQSGSTWTQVGDILPAGTTSYTVSGLSASTAYTYRLITENAAGDSAPSATSTATTYLPRPQHLTGSANSDTSVTINWNAVTGATSYLTEISTDGSTWTTVDTISAPATTDTITTYTPSGGSATPLTGATQYYFRVQAVASGNDSSPSNVRKITTLLGAPSALSISSPSTTGLTIGWTDGAGATSYVIQKQIHSTWVTAATLSSLSGTGTETEAVTGLHAGNTYNFRVIGQATGSTSAPATISGTTLPTSTVVTATGALAGGITVNWVKIPGATSYEILSSADNNNDFAQIGTEPAGTLSYTDSSVSTANTQQYYEVAGVIASVDGQSSITGAVSPIVSSYSLAGAPAAFAATALSDTAVGFSWTAESAATSFRLEKEVGTGSSATWPQVGQLIANTGGTVASYQLNGLTANTAYNFRLIAVNGGGDSAPSTSGGVAVTTKVPAPTLTGTTVTDTAAGLSWPAVTSATGYKVWRSTNPNGTFTQVGSVTIPVSPLTTYTFTDNATTDSANTPTQGTTYYYYVTATDAGGDSVPSNTVTQTTLLTTPSGFTAVSNESTSVDFSWTLPTTTIATNYLLQQLATGTTYNTVATLDGQADTASVTGLTAGTAYTFHLVAVNSNAANSTAASATITTLTAAPAVATEVASATTTGSTTTNTITLTWPSVTGAASYIVQRSTDGVSWTSAGTPTAATGTTQTFADSGTTQSPLAADTLYYYRVAAVNSTGGASAYSPVVSTTTLLAAPATPTATSISASEIDLSWTTQPTAVAYIVQQNTGTTTTPVWTQVGDQIPPTATTTTAQVTGLTANTAYSFRVIAVNDGGNSAPTAAVSATTAPKPTKVTATTLSDTAISLNWTTVTGAGGYTIYQQTGGSGSFTAISGTSLGATATGYTVTGLTANTQYAFYVVATGVSPIANSVPSNTVSRYTFLAAPAAPTVSNDQTNPTTELDLAWTQTTGNNGYLVQQLIGTVWTTIGYTSQGTNSYTAGTNSLYPLLPGVSYSFRIAVLNASGVSLPGNAGSGTTTTS
jgi:titin